MYKAGATFRDKNRIRKLYAGGLEAQQISDITRIRLPHTEAIIEQIKAGTLHISAGERRAAGKGSYGDGEQDGGDAMRAVRNLPRTDTAAVKAIQDANAETANQAERADAAEKALAALKEENGDAETSAEKADEEEVETETPAGDEVEA